MSVIHADFPSGSQGIYGSTTSDMLDGLWAENTGVTLPDDPDPNITGRVMKFTGGAGSIATLTRFVLPATRDTVGMACRVYLPSIPTSDAKRPYIQQYRDGSNNVLASVVISPAGLIQVYKGTISGTLLAATTVPVITAGAWRHVESEIFFSATVGTVKVYVEGEEVINANTLNTGATPCAQVAHASASDGTGASTTFYVKDLVYRDALGTQNNTIMGVVGVYWRPVSGDVSSGWTSTGANDYGVLDETPASDADYISADNTLPAASIMTFDSLPADIVAIKAIVSVTRAEKTDGGEGKVQVSLSPNGATWDDGADKAVTTAFAYHTDVSEISPVTTDPWTPIEFDSLEIKVNRTV